MDVDKHTIGAFSWPELATSDQKAGVAFYRSLFGWDVKEAPLGPGEIYSMFTLRGREAGAAYTMRPDEKQMGIPPHWNAYITVENVDASAKRAAELGAKVLAPPFDVMDAGRMAVLQDPAGAVFQIWQPNRSIGARVLNEPGALCWTELSTRDTKAAAAFYTQFLGWKAKVGGDGVNAYTEFTPAGGEYPVAGMIDIAAFGDRGNAGGLSSAKRDLEVGLEFRRNDCGKARHVFGYIHIHFDGVDSELLGGRTGMPAPRGQVRKIRLCIGAQKN